MLCWTLQNTHNTGHVAILVRGDYLSHIAVSTRDYRGYMSLPKRELIPWDMPEMLKMTSSQRLDVNKEGPNTPHLWRVNSQENRQEHLHAAGPSIPPPLLYPVSYPSVCTVIALGPVTAYLSEIGNSIMVEDTCFVSCVSFIGQVQNGILSFFYLGKTQNLLTQNTPKTKPGNLWK